MHGVRAVALVVVVASVLVACRPTSPGPPPPALATPTATPSSSSPSGTLRWAISEPDALNPAEVVERDALLVVDALFDSLTSYGDDLEADPAAATRWTSDDGGQTWVFELRPSATWHDGEPVTAQDFVFAWNHAVQGDGAGHHLRDVVGYPAVRDGRAKGLAGLVARDAHTLEVRLDRPRADFPLLAAHPGLGPLPTHAWKEDPEFQRQRPVGNGPFRMAEVWARGQFVRLAIFDEWRNGPPPRVAEVLFRIADPDTAYVALQQGRVDVSEVPAGALDDALEEYGTSVSGGPGVLRGDLAALYYLGFDLDHPPFDDVEVRRGVSMAIDRVDLATRILEGNVRPARRVVPRALDAGEDFTCSACGHEPLAAQVIFAERGIRELTLWFNRGGGHEAVARIVREHLAQVGVRVVFRTTPSGALPAYLSAIGSEAGWFRFGWTADHPTWEDVLSPLLHSAAVPQVGGANHGGYAAGDVDALIDEARSTLDRRVRRDRYAAAEKLALDRDQVLVPLFTYRQRTAVNARVAGLELGPTGLPDLTKVELREVPSEKPTG